MDPEGSLREDVPPGPVQKGRVGGLHGVQGFTETDRDGEGRKEGMLTGRHLGQSENPAKM